MKIKKRFFVIIILIAAIAVTALFVLREKDTQQKVEYVERVIRPMIGPIFTTVSTTGIVLPQNRVEVMPPSTGGRIDKILVREGDFVKAGQLLALLSSNERANIIDSAQGAEEKEYWENVYKPTLIKAPISGTIIVRAFEPGQTVVIGKAILVISDRLIVKANVDETDIGKIKVGQTAKITLDAYPDVSAMAKVTHIKYESTSVNNVTTYEVHITPDNTPEVFKSGMNSTIEIYDNYKKNALLVMNMALIQEGGGTYILVKKGDQTEKVPVETGLTNSMNTEIISGITRDDQIVFKQQKLSLPPDFKPNSGANSNQGSGGMFLFGPGRR